MATLTIEHTNGTTETWNVDSHTDLRYIRAEILRFLGAPDIES